MELTEGDRRDVLERVTNRVRAAYAQQRCRVGRIPSFAPKDPKWIQCFEKTALVCMERKIDPYEYMEVLFKAYQPYPRMNQLYGTTAQSVFDRHRRLHAGHVAERTMLQISSFERQMETGYKDSDVLRDEDQDYDALFVYVTAKLRGLPFADDYFKSALIQYLLSVHYDAIYGDLIPEELKREAALIKEAS